MSVFFNTVSPFCDRCLSLVWNFLQNPTQAAMLKRAFNGQKVTNKLSLTFKFTFDNLKINSVIIIKTNVLLPQTYVTLVDFVYPVYVLWFYCPQKTLNYLAIQSFDCERTCWRLSQKRIVRTICNTCIFISSIWISSNHGYLRYHTIYTW
jgi:hypothetical protein